MYFGLIVQLGSLGKAAKALGISQPALSISMDRLEEELKTSLLVRTPTGVEPTAMGESLVRYARQIFECVSAVESAVFGTGVASKEILSFGCLPTLAGSVIPQAIGRWRQTHPEWELQVTERPQNELLWGLLRREYDFAVGVVDRDNQAYGLRQRVLFRERLYVAARPDHPLSKKETVTIRDLTHYPWVSPTTGWRNTALEHILEPAGLSLYHKVTVCSSITLLKSLVAESNNLALLPAHAVKEEMASNKLTLLPLSQENLERSIAVFIREGATPDRPSLALLNLIREQGRTRYIQESGNDG
ncbi:LysR family transcriptional regulator [Rhizobium vallis]|uniref:LysR family transcriptional regulator n=2 Tax=Rhizobium vallis TaxID=634290 RepID=A0A432PJH7_9HYPH|nr:LysR family transcriptional regulator [Rhizobium vallis]